MSKLDERVRGEYGRGMVKKVIIRVPPDLDAWLRRRAAREERSLSCLARRILAQEQALDEDREKDSA